jgi:hypothetical protein
MISLQTPYFIVYAEGAGFAIRVKRTGLDYPDMSTMERDMDSVVAVLDRLGRDRKGICIDWREGPMRNDRPFEDMIRRMMPRLVRGFRAVSVIVRSAVGALQAKRHFREAGFVGEVFQDEAEALDYLRVTGAVAPRRPTPVPPRGERMATGQLQAVERTPQGAGMRGDRPSSLPPMASERPNFQASGRDRASTLPPPPAAERISQLPEDRQSDLPLPPPGRPPRI